ncbi:MAG TPA: UDP-N-acetylmuramoyl-L-alanine--D-glutamate ligase [Clostridiales bacterium]|nr:UDP-N-acetylmuramoyl-L-alanine--D-glutamate ligase [Clostridiales bacterium]
MSNPKLIRSQFHEKQALILGVARSGLAAAKLILYLGGTVVLYDRKSLEELQIDQELLTHPKVKSSFGKEELPDIAFDFAVYSPGIPQNSPLLEAVRKKAIPLVGELEFASMYIPCPFAAVSGTNGKTTTVSLLGQMFQDEGFHVEVAGNIGHPLSEAVMHLSSNDRLVVEVSSFQLESTNSFHPNCAALLNVTPDHIDRHETMENYVQLKKHLFHEMNEDDLVVLNAADKLCTAMLPDLQTSVQLFSTKHPTFDGAYYTNEVIFISRNGHAKKLINRREVFLPGDHNIENVLAAICLAKYLGCGDKAIVKALKEFKGVEHRIELVNTQGNIRYYNDSKGTNPESTMKAVSSMMGPFVLIAGGYDKQTPFEEMARITIARENFVGLVVLGDTAKQIATAFEQAGAHLILYADSLKEAINLATSICPEGGNVLYSPACSSFDMFSNYEERGRIFKHLVCSRDNHV